MPAAPLTALAYRAELTSLRAVAVGIVLIQHWLRPAFPLGELGPSIFFVLSGYLVSGIIWKYDAYVGAPGGWRRRLGTFYLRRGLRIVPLYYLALAGCALLPLAAVRESPGWFLLPGANLLIYKRGGWPDGMGHFWTIAIEMQFYLLWPIMLGIIGKRINFLLALVALSWLFRALWSAWVGPSMVHLLLPTNIDLFALGALLRLEPSWLASVAKGWYVLLAWLGWIALRLLPDFTGAWAAGWASSQAIWLAMADFLTIGWLLCASGAGQRLGLHHPVVQWVGKRSYAMYLFHLPLLVFWQRLVYHLVPDASGRSFWMGAGPLLVVLLPVLAIISAASWRFVEAPIDKIKERFRYAFKQPAPKHA
ncbi:MAG TPA: acyltransferase [Hymenobacter sp.]|jgi:peptidoglycan/LPS O-acetylase OafA/YrhL|uniref:acyltransferase family protein n=1 Tax=Hymenobacter sp. TaxID=1898978 RepID=UPI002ED94C0F